jgi:glycosyltransferase involved in cell wall biosynthesis
MDILHVVSRSQRRGAERVAVELAEELDKLGHRNSLVALARGMDGTEDANLPALVRSASLAWPARAMTVARLGRHIGRARPDIVLAHGGTATQLTVASVWRHRPPVVWQQILPFPPKIREQPRRAFWWAVTRRIDGAIALTNDAAQDIRNIGFTGQVRVIPNFRRPQRFIDVERSRASAELRQALSVSPETRLIGFVGYLVPQKRPERALDVLEDVRRAGVDAYLVIAGDGPLQESFEREVKERGMESYVSLLGHRDDVECVFGGVDVAIMTSDVEGMPGVAIEAAMAGCPFVTFPVGAVREVVEEGVTGLVLERADAGLMATRVVELLRDDRGRERMSGEARRRSHRFAAGDSVRQYADALAQCHDARASRKRRRRQGDPATTR